MKTLYIIRHAKSSWSDPNLDDHDRPLNKRGERDKLVMAKFIKANFGDMQTLFTSSALRALDYAACIHQHAGIKLEIDESLYTFSSKQLLSFIVNLPNELNIAAIVGHNPAVTEVINHLASLGPHEKIVNLPTAAVVKLQFDSGSWNELAPESGKVIDFAKPKALDSFEDDLD